MLLEIFMWARVANRVVLCLIMFFYVNCVVLCLTFRHRASSILGQAFRYSPENAFYIFNQQIYNSLSDIRLTVHH